MSPTEEPSPPLRAPFGPREAADLWLAVGDRAVAADDPRAALLAFEQAAAAARRAGDPPRQIIAHLERAAALCELGRWDDLSAVAENLLAVRNTGPLPAGSWLQATLFARFVERAE
ncbi:MAG TPA: hypothetical protein VN783_11510, partial [Thermoanaerobaculia bacterium]|nr:hypothetical protein [Thermoanaerobaculia bacterium]